MNERIIVFGAGETRDIQEGMSTAMARIKSGEDIRYVKIYLRGDDVRVEYESRFHGIDCPFEAEIKKVMGDLGFVFKEERYL